MRSLFWSVVLAVGLIADGSPVRGADDPAPVGTTWTGILKRFGAPNDKGNRITSMDAKISIVERDGEAFTGRFVLRSGELVQEIQGKITAQGAMTFTPTKQIKPPPGDDGPRDVIGRANFVGAIKEGTLKLKYTIPKNTSKKLRGLRFGALELKLDE